MSAPSDLTVVIPTRDRWPILQRTLAALAAQTVTGFDIVVAVDGEDQRPPDLPGARVVVKPAGGSASTRNAGMAQVTTPLAMKTMTRNNAATGRRCPTATRGRHP